MITPAQTIDEVIEQLSDIIAWAQANHSRLGYFPALYRKVTIAVKQGIIDGMFEDGERMERLDVIFANRYIEAFYQHQDGQTPTASWQCAFAAAQSPWPIVLQHLLLGMNAHINLDLGIAAAQTSPGDQLPGLQKDFDTINQLLASLVGEVQMELAEIWPILGLLNRYLGSVEKSVINFSMEKARDAAWEFAEQLAPLSEVQQQSLIAKTDNTIANFAKVIRYPGITGMTLMALIRLGERGNTRSRIDTLL